MRGQVGRKNKRKEIKLVRVRSYDGKRNTYGDKNAKRQGIAILLSVIFLLAACGTGICYARLESSAQESMSDSISAISLTEISQAMERNLYKDVTELSGINASDIVVLEEEQEPGIPLVAIDAGHGGEDCGCDRAGVLEKEINMQLASRLSDKLQELGYDTLLVREDNDTALKLQDRVDKAEAAGADIYISIHQNACDEKESYVNGIETWFSGCPEKVEGANWYCACCDDSRRLAQLVQSGAVSKTGANDRGIQQSQELYVIREVSMPACLIETSFLSNEKERNAVINEEYQEKLAAGMAQGIDYYFNPKTMYLTFDDGPSEENTSKILDILSRRHIKATFFVVGENVRKHPEVARRIVEEGHTIGIHCNRHVYDEIYQSVDSFLEDFQAAYDAVYEVTGVEVELFRFPGGSINAYNKDVYEEIIEKMTERGFIYFDWNASLEDAVKSSTPEDLIQNAVTSTLNRKKVVMLAHDIVYNTTLCLDELLDSLPEYKMEPLTSEVSPIQF